MELTSMFSKPGIFSLMYWTTCAMYRRHSVALREVLDVRGSIMYAQG
jgi:hypothetical protein